MAFLLLLYEKLSLQRKYNKLTLEATRNSHRLDRVAKNIERVQKMYAKQETTLDQQSKNWSAMAKNSIWSSAGLNSNQMGFNPMNFGMGNGMSICQMQAMQQALTSNSELQKKLGDGVFEKMMAEYQAGTLSKTDTDPNVAAADRKYGTGQFTSDQYNAFMQLVGWAGQAESQVRMQANNAATQYDTSLNNYVARCKEQIDEEQELALAPLEALQTEYQLEKESIDMQMEQIKARLESVKQACSEGIKDSAPKFGLG